MIVLDASVLIAVLDERDAQHATAVARLISGAGEPFACSPITLAETLVAPARHGRLRDAQRAVEDLAVQTIDLPVDAPGRLATLRAQTGLTLPDCCVLLAAEIAHASVITLDERLTRVATDRGLGSPE